MSDEEDFRTTKTGLWNLLRDPVTTLPVLEDAVLRTNEIVTRAWFFLKLYMLTYNGVKVDRTLTELILKVVSTVGKSRKFSANEALMSQLQELYRRDFQPLLPPGDAPPSRSGLKQVMKYEAVKMVAVFETHLKCHYPDYVKDACAVVYQRRVMREQYKGKKFVPFERKFRDLLHDVLTVDGRAWKSDPVDHDGVHYLRSLALPAGKTFEKQNLQYDLKANPQDYFSVLEGMTALTENTEERPSLRNLWPLRTTLVPRYIRIDTMVLVELLVPPSERKQFTSKVKASAFEVWQRFFHLDAKVFRGKKFHHMLETDGVATSVLFEWENVPVVKKSKSKNAVPTESYLDELPPATLQSLRSRKVVSIDPGMSDLLSCISEVSTTTTPEKLRYTQNQRRFDLKTVSRRRQLQYEKDHTIIAGKTVTTHETELSAYNHKTVNIKKFKQYLRAKFLFNSQLAPFYRHYHFRKDRFNTFIDTQKSERAFLNKFRRTFGTPTDTVVAFGDWEQRQHRKYKEPTKGKGFRQMLRRDGYDVFLVDEHKSSVQCSSCCSPSARCHKFRRRLDPNTSKPQEQRHRRDVHGLLVCNTCSRLWNRDVNAPLNMNTLTRACLEGRPRPFYLQRGNTFSTVSTILPTVQGICKDVKIHIRW